MVFGYADKENSVLNMLDLDSTKNSSSSTSIIAVLEFLSMQARRILEVVGIKGYRSSSVSVAGSKVRQ